MGRGAALLNLGPLQGVKLRNLPAWLAHRAYHGAVIPTVRRKIRVVAGWLVEAATGRETVSLAATQHPRHIFEESFDALPKPKPKRVAKPKSPSDGD